MHFCLQYILELAVTDMLWPSIGCSSLLQAVVRTQVRVDDDEFATIFLNYLHANFFVTGTYGPHTELASRYLPHEFYCSVSTEQRRHTDETQHQHSRLSKILLL